MRDLVKTTITSMEVAQMVGKKHYDLLKDIRKYTEQLDEGKISVVDFHIHGIYSTKPKWAWLDSLVHPCLHGIYFAALRKWR